MRRMSLLHQNSGSIGKPTPTALKISLDPRDGISNTSLVLVEQGYNDPPQRQAVAVKVSNCQSTCNRNSSHQKCNGTLPMHWFHSWSFKLHHKQTILHGAHQSNALMQWCTANALPMYCNAVPILDRLHILHKRRPPGLHKRDFLIWRPNLIWKAVQGISNGIWSLNLVWFDAKTWSDVKKMKCNQRSKA